MDELAQQYSFSLYPSDVEILDSLVENTGMSRSAMVRVLIRQAHDTKVARLVREVQETVEKSRQRRAESARVIGGGVG